ncbi:MAG: hypothetical protein HFJ02_02335 [Bacilli bacterium]|nr:hypothetical protein [Bacilli bacterium]
MKTIFPKFKINSLTYLIFLSFLLTGFIKNILLIFLIVVVHELGHFFFLNYFSYEVEKIEIYPFGGVTTTNKYINSPINKDLIIYFGGVFFQLLLFLVFYFLFKKNWIHDNTFSLFQMYNQSILFFNLLPIRPLDGGEILQLLLQKWLPFYRSLVVMNYISCFFIGVFLLINIKCNLNNYIIVSFLIGKTLISFRDKNLIQNKFLLERYLHRFSYKKIEHNALQDTYVLKKETLHFFKDKEKYIHEKEFLKTKFEII